MKKGWNNDGVIVRHNLLKALIKLNSDVITPLMLTFCIQYFGITILNI